MGSRGLFCPESSVGAADLGRLLAPQLALNRCNFNSVPSDLGLLAPPDLSPFRADASLTQGVRSEDSF